MIPLPRAVGALCLAALAAGFLADSSTAQTRSAALADLVVAAKPSVVAIGLFAPLQNPQFRFRASGFAVGDGRQVATCAHVLPTLDPARRETIAVAIPGPESTRVYRARAVSIDRDVDLAILEFDGPTLPALPMASQAEVREGIDVALMGFPLGNALGLFPAVHRGVIAAMTPLIVPAAGSAGLRAQSVQVMRGPPIQLLQLDATTFPGNSGGPLIDIETGRVVGVVSLGLMKGTRENAIENPTGISYAVPVRYLLPLLREK